MAFGRAAISLCTIINISTRKFTFQISSIINIKLLVGINLVQYQFRLLAEKVNIEAAVS